MKKYLTLLITLALLLTATVGYCSGNKSNEPIAFECPLTSKKIVNTPDEIIKDGDLRAQLTILLCKDFAEQAPTTYGQRQMDEFLSHNSYVIKIEDRLIVAGHIGEQIFMFAYDSAEKKGYCGIMNLPGNSDDAMDRFIQNALGSQGTCYQNDRDTMDKLIEEFSEKS